MKIAGLYQTVTRGIIRELEQGAAPWVKPWKAGTSSGVMPVETRRPKNIRRAYVKTVESGNKRRHAFCGDCGTPIYACAVDNPQSLCPARRYDHPACGLLTAAAKLEALCAALGRHARRRAGDRERVTR